MTLELSDQYYLKAADNLGYDIETSLEALNYALSYDPEHAPSHCLSGKICGQYLKSYDRAFHHLELAMLYDPYYPDSYCTYAWFLIQNGRFAKADRVLYKAIQVETVDKYSVFVISGLGHELKCNWYLATTAWKRARLLTATCDQINYVDTALKRVKVKQEKLQPKKKGKSKK